MTPRATPQPGVQMETKTAGLVVAPATMLRLRRGLPRLRAVWAKLRLWLRETPQPCAQV